MNMPQNEDSDEEQQSPQPVKPQQPKEVPAKKPAKNANLLEFEEDPVINNRAPSHSPALQTEPHHAHFDPDIRRPAQKLPPLETKSQGFDMVPANKGNSSVPAGHPMRQAVSHQP